VSVSVCVDGIYSTPLTPSHRRELRSHLITSHLEVLGEVVHNLSTVVPCSLAPPALRGMGGLDGVPNVLPIALAHLSENLTLRDGVSGLAIRTLAHTTRIKSRARRAKAGERADDHTIGVFARARACVCVCVTFHIMSEMQCEPAHLALGTLDDPHVRGVRARLLASDEQLVRVVD
jgi:hypothetical protein